MQLIESDTELATVPKKMTDSETIQTGTDNGVVDNITDTESFVKCNGKIDDSIVMKITDEVVTKNTSLHKDEVGIHNKNDERLELYDVLNMSKVAQINGVKTNIQKEEYFENNHMSAANMEVNKTGDTALDNIKYTPEGKEKGNETPDCNDGENIEQLKNKTAAAMDIVTESIPVDKEKEDDNCNDSTAFQTKDLVELNTKITAAIDTVTESTSLVKAAGNDNINYSVGITTHTEELEQYKNKTTADSLTESSLEGKERGNQIDGIITQTEDMAPHENESDVTKGEIDSAKDSNSEKNLINNNNRNAENVDNDATKIVDVLLPEIKNLKESNDAMPQINVDDNATVKDYILEDNENSNDTITVDNEYLSIKQTIDDCEDKDDMAALVYSNSESEDANDQASSDSESISNAEGKILYENENCDSMEVTETAISISVTEAISRLTDSPITTVLEENSMEVTDGAISKSVAQGDGHCLITTVSKESSANVDDLSATENIPNIDVQEINKSSVDINSMEIDHESNLASNSSVPIRSYNSADCNNITHLQEEPGANLGMKSLNDKSENDNHTNTQKVVDVHEQSDNSDLKEVDSIKSTVLENIADNDYIIKVCKSSITNNENENNEKSSQHNNDCSDNKVDQEIKAPSDEKNISNISEKPLIINKNVSAETSAPRVEGSKKKEKEKKGTASMSRLANTLDILSDDDEEQVQNVKNNCIVEKPRISLEEDDDIMLIDDDSSSKECEKNQSSAKQELDKQVQDTLCKNISTGCKSDTDSANNDNGSGILMSILKSSEGADEQQAVVSDEVKKPEEKEKGPLVIPNLVQTFKSDISNMTRVDLEEFCLLKIVEGLIDRNNLSEIKTKLKSMVQHVEEWRKKAMMLTKQNRDLQIVLKTVQEDQKKRTVGQITPLRITRSVGMQVFMNENAPPKRSKVQHSVQNKHHRPPSSPQQKPPKAISIPVPRLVPATNNSPLKVIKSPPPQIPNNMVNIPIKQVTTTPLTVSRAAIPQTKTTEKRPHNNSVTVDLTDDEPPSKQANVSKTPSQKFRLVPSQQLLQSQASQPTRMATPNANTRKVYIPISGTQNQCLAPGQTIFFKSITPAARARGPTPTKMTTPTRVVSATIPRHPAPLPEIGKQPRPSHWKPLPPSPELKISKVENGIVISWKIDGYQEDIFEKIASYQLFAYQETTAPPSTLHWKKIGDVKALALPMACTLTQFMAGYKYYFAVRAVDIRSRFGPFSLPGSILLMNKKD